MLAEAAAKANIPYIMSGASNDSIEATAKVAPANAWYQLYAAREAGVREDMIRRTADAGMAALVLTVDVPVSSKRERNIRNGFANVRGGLFQALSLKPSILAEALTHPGWIVDYLRHGGGTPMMQNWQPYAAAGGSAEQVYNFARSIQPFDVQSWRDLERYRHLFPRSLIVKGIMSPADALRAAEIGVDGIIVSNHGGRQLDQAPASLDVLSAISEAVGDKLAVLLDSGIRRGADILIALCLGAKFVFMGRPTRYGATAGGIPGVSKALRSCPKSSIWSWGRSAVRASPSAAPISCGGPIGSATNEPARIVSNTQSFDLFPPRKGGFRCQVTRRADRRSAGRTF
jgi:(S)-mandelate dehydrogenase